jgi:ssDNA-binding Zn-finger/Zn-ribbon topoisomerase 1
MLLREAKKGTNIGQSFWGCSNFPKCRTTIKIENV